jgi:hypothetical protein
MRSSVLAVTFGVSLALGGCSGKGISRPASEGGPPVGGNGDTGGTTATGGDTVTGGATATGGVTDTGGSLLGGTTAAGGATATSGVTANGGSIAAGGVTAGAGKTVGSGMTAIGGTKGTGGVTGGAGGAATGGTTGGAPAAGGSATTGGAISTGGVPAAGGATGTSAMTLAEACTKNCTLASGLPTCSTTTTECEQNCMTTYGNTSLTDPDLGPQYIAMMICLATSFTSSADFVCAKPDRALNKWSLLVNLASDSPCSQQICDWTCHDSTLGNFDPWTSLRCDCANP